MVQTMTTAPGWPCEQDQDARVHPTRYTADRPGATYLNPLTGMRFVAAVLVVLHHFCHFFNPGVSRASAPLDTVVMALHNAVTSGFVGVNFFFILSGFILSYSYLDRDGTSLRGGRRAFWVTRIARIYPLYLLAFILAAPPFLWHHDVTAPPAVTAVTTATLIQAWIPFVGTAWNAPGWSLSVEAFCYLLFPLIALPVARLNSRRLYFVLGTLFATSLGISLVYLVCNSPVLGLTRGMEGYWLRVVEFNPLLRLPQFAMGIALGRLFVLSREVTSTPAEAWWRRPGVAAGGALLGIVCILAIGPYLPRTLLSHGPLDLLFAVLIYSVAGSKGCLARFFSLPALLLVGEASYALYILQVPMWEWMVSLLHVPGDAALNSPLFFLAYLCLAVGLSILSLRYIERPARRAITGALLGRPSPRGGHASQPGPLTALQARRAE